MKEPTNEDKIKALLDLSEKMDVGVVEIHEKINAIRATLVLLLKDFDEATLRYAISQLTGICMENGIRIPVAVKRRIGFTQT